MPENSVKIEVPDKLTFFFDQNYVRYRVAYGGRTSGKSWAAERGLLVRAIQKKIRILCCREYQNSIGESVKHTLEENIELLGQGAVFPLPDQAKPPERHTLRELRSKRKPVCVCLRKSTAGWLHYAKIFSIMPSQHRLIKSLYTMLHPGLI